MIGHTIMTSIICEKNIKLIFNEPQLGNVDRLLSLKREMLLNKLQMNIKIKQKFVYNK